ncbi:hypothetical protein DPSP01_008524 [Paraphaeosphaeria sporulosa]
MSLLKLGLRIWLSDFFYMPAAALISHRVFENIPDGAVSDYCACIWGTALGTLIARAATVWFEYVTDTDTDSDSDSDSKDTPASLRSPQQDRAAGLPEQARAA